ncbi:zinc ribbon domain-containing protein [Ktedonobacter racemifer]|uniref:Ig-like domain-containing protein n=1 Tax=Ktedonobacter racemifer DSM 44963 TaxID=485913 RepID=D6TKC1_KTERA|nr:zinc ribbon domain-containing protein [Ktedonobacter racemifer]EFH86221.1 hypothetical protein Krac_7511 [Ktedonobacter racemifer DSM 44963]
MSRCIYCGTENPEDARFCSSCGRSGQDEQNITATERHEPAEGEQTLILPEGLASKAQIKNAGRQEEPPLEGAIPPIGIGGSGQGSTQVPGAPGTPQAPQVTSAPGTPSTPQPAANAAAKFSANTHASQGASTASQNARSASHARAPQNAQAQHTGATHAQAGQTAAQHTVAHTAIKGGTSAATKVIVAIVAVIVVAAGSIGAFAFAHQNQQRQQQASKHPASTATGHNANVSTQAGPNTFIVTGALNGTLTNLHYNDCGYSPTKDGFGYVMDVGGTLNNQSYSLDIRVINTEKPGSYTYPVPASTVPTADQLMPGVGFNNEANTQIWYTDGSHGHGNIVINNGSLSGTLSAVDIPEFMVAGTPVPGDKVDSSKKISITGNWICPDSFKPTPTTPPVTANIFTVSGAVNGTLTITNYLTCGMTPNGSAVAMLATGTLNGETYHLNFLFPHYHGPGTYTDPSSPGNVTMNFNNSSQTWSTNGSDAQGSATVNSDNNSGTLNALTVPGVNGASGTHITITGAWSC